jgi:steroid 5-alpha reductase family enzyme
LAARTRSSKRPALAVGLGLLGVVAIPAAIAYSRYDDQVSLVDAAWAIPVAAACSIATLLIVRGMRGHVQASLAPPRSVRLARLLGIAGVCLTLSATIAVGFYELLLQLEA